MSRRPAGSRESTPPGRRSLASPRSRDAEEVNLRWIRLAACSFVDHRLDDLVVPLVWAAPAEVGVRLDSQITVWFEGSGVRLCVAITATPRSQPAFTAHAAYAAEFGTASGGPELLHAFAWNDGIEVLLTLVRERLFLLTAASGYSPFLMVGMDVSSLVQHGAIHTNGPIPPKR